MSQSPDSHDEVARLLRDAALSGPMAAPMPADVATRLDAILAREAADASEARVGRALRPRPRRWPAVMLAAAAVSVVGYLGATYVAGNQAADTSTAGAGEAEVAQDSAGSRGEADGGSSRNSVEPPPALAEAPTAPEPQGATEDDLAADALEGAGAPYLARTTACPTPSASPAPSPSRVPSPTSASEPAGPSAGPTPPEECPSP